MKSGNLELDLEAPLRINKGRGTRVVCRGRYGDTPAIIKLFRGLPKAWWHWKICNLHGKAVRERGIPSPRVLWSGWDDSLKAYLIVYENLQDARDYEWIRQTPGFQERLPGYRGLLTLLAQMHAKGVEQSDTTPGNFLEQDGIVYAIDEDRMNIRTRALSTRRSLRNVASLITQFQQLTPQEVSTLYDAYCHDRGWRVSSSDLKNLTKHIENFRNWRKDKRGYRRKNILRYGSIVLVLAAGSFLLFLGVR